MHHTHDLEPAELLLRFGKLFACLAGPVLDLASGAGRNGLYLASLGAQVVLCDRNAEALARAQAHAMELGLHPLIWQADLEQGSDLLPRETFEGMVVFRYLHRPLMASIRQALRPGGLLAYETFTVDQPRYGKPHNPDFLLRHGELLEAFRDFEIIHWFEGVLHNPTRAAAQLVCRKPRKEAE